MLTDFHSVELESKITVRWCLQIKKPYSLLYKMTLRGKDLASTVLVIIIGVLTVQTLPCHRTEYRINDECCPMCPPGSRVKTHCTEFRSTSCLPCSDGTYLDKQNGLLQCNPCSSCDSGSGLKVKQPCMPISDTVCEPVEGFFCIDSTTSGCSAAQKHKSCEPGQYIREKGTASRDAQCSDCSRGTFSNGTMTSCQKHTQCESKNLQLIKAGNASTDAECGEKSPDVTVTVVIVVVVVVFLCLVIGIAVWYKIKGKIKCSGNVMKDKEDGRNNVAMNGNEGKREEEEFLEA